MAKGSPKVEWKIRGTLKVEDFLIPNTTVDIDAPHGTADWV